MKKHKPDSILLFTVFGLLIFGLVILSSASVVISQENFGKPYHYFFHQLIYGAGIGLACFLIVQKINYRFWKKWALPLLFLSVVLLVLVFIPDIGYGYGGAERWIKIGFLSLQPSEVMKLVFIVYLASWLEKRKKEVRSFSQGILPFLIVVSIIGTLIVLQPDIGTLGIIMIVGILIYFIAGARISHIIYVILGSLSALFAFIKIAPYRMSRLIVFLHPETDPRGIGYQINQALLAIGSGGLFGLGLGHSIQKYKYLPEIISDSIFAILAEEIGFLGGVFLIILFLLLAFRGFKIAKRSPDIFGKLLAVGITSWLVLQAFINIGAITGLIPLTGIPLPFISYGGSALVISLIGAGVLVNISKHTV